MPDRLRLTLAAAIASLALAPAASAHDWHGASGGQGYEPGSGQTYPSSQGTNGGAWDGPGYSDNTGASPYQANGWDPSEGDPQETPSVWNQSPPTTSPTTTGGGNTNPQNPWANIPALPVSKTPTVPGNTAMIRRNGLAAVPRGAPASVRAIITAANQIIGKPYKWGGGHGLLFDTGYDCSGSVSYALIRARLLNAPMVSGTLAHFGVKGAGRYVTIYANSGHVYMEVAGLRLDTSSVGDPNGKSGVRWRPPIGKRFGFAVRHLSGI